MNTEQPGSSSLDSKQGAPETTSAGSQSSARPVGWYVHLPFCHSKCGYCDFYSLPTREDWIPDIVEAATREIAARDPRRPVRSIFVGGGTPTVMPADALQEVLTAIPPLASPDAEFTVEANPSSSDELKLELLRRCGVNRVSFGAQSFHADELAVLERLHSPEHIPEAVKLARKAGFDNINLDLIFGVPGQTVDRWLDSLHRAMALEVDHIACYSLMYEEGTALTKRLRNGLVRPCDEDLEAEMYERTIEVLGNAGYAQYEVSNFCRPGRECQHNLIYWQNEEYVGIGPSAVSFLDGRRQKNVPDVKKWVEAVRTGQSAFVEEEQLEPAEFAQETAIQMLRLVQGVDKKEFKRITGLDVDHMFAGPIARFIASGHLECTENHLRLTPRGMLVANRVMVEFLDSTGPRTISLV